MTNIDRPISLSGWNALTANEITRKLKQVAHEEADSRNNSWALTRIAEETTVFSVWGDRGTGKSSILASVAQCLMRESNPNFLVIGPIQPELFGPSDSILNVALAELKNKISDIARKSHIQFSIDDDDWPTILTSLERAQLTAAVSRTTLEMISNAASTVDEFGRQLQRVSGATSDLWERLSTATTQVCDACGLIVIIVDDPDLASPQTSSTLRDLRNLGSLPGVAVLVGASKSNIRQVIFRRNLVQEDDRQGQESQLTLSSSEAISFEQKVFPASRAFYTSVPTSTERINFKKVGQSRTIINLVDSHIEEVGGLLRRALTSTSDLTKGSPLPERYRALVQIWDHLNGLLTSSTLGSMGYVVELSRLCETLLSQIQQPRGVRTPLSITWGPMVPSSSGEKRQVEVKLFSLLPGIATDGGFWDPNTNDKSAVSGVSLQLRAIESLNSSPRWAKDIKFSGDDFDYNAHADDMPTLLAVQELLWDSGVFELDDETDLGGGLRPPEFSFLQRLRIEGQDTDDYFVTLPNAKTWSSVLRTGEAWNSITNRWRNDNLSVQAILALSIEAALEISHNGSFVSDAAPTVYRDALWKLEQALIDLNSKTNLTLAEQELINWYVGFVPAHWHSSIFECDEISSYISSWLRIAPLFSSSYSYSRVQRKWTLIYRVRRMLEESFDAGRARKFAWLGGYGRVVRAIDSPDFPLDKFERIRRLWDQRLKTRRRGAAITQTSKSQKHATDVTGSDGESLLTDDSSDKNASVVEPPLFSTFADAEELSDELMEAAFSTIDKWQNNENSIG